MRHIAPFLAMLWMLACGTSTWVVLRHHVDRARIVQEECVQRDMPSELRTCYGRCQLIRALNDLRKQEQHGAPVEITVKWEPEATAQQADPILAFHDRTAVPTGPEKAAALRPGHPCFPEGVPRS
jgi:hypothetical protein